MTQSSNCGGQSLGDSQCETENSLNFRDLVAAKVGSILRDLVGLPSAFSRSNNLSLHNEWHDNVNDEREAEQNGEPESNIPIKKSSDWLQNKSCSINDTSGLVQRELGEKKAERGISNTSKPYDLWDQIFYRLHSTARGDDDLGMTMNGMSRLDRSSAHDLSNLFYSPIARNKSVIEQSQMIQKNDLNEPCANNFKESSPYLPFNFPMMIFHDFIAEADNFSRQLSQEIFGIDPGNITRPRFRSTSIAQQPSFESSEVENRLMSRYGRQSFETFTTPVNHKEFIAQNPLKSSYDLSEGLPAIINPFDGQFSDGAQTELDVYNFFTNWINNLNSSKRPNSGTNTQDSAEYQLHSAQENPTIPATYAFDVDEDDASSSKNIAEYNSMGANRVVSFLSSTKRHLDQDGKMHVSVQTCKTYADGRSTSTTKDYIE